MRTIQAACVRLYVYSALHAPQVIGWATNFRISAAFQQNAQYAIDGTNQPYELLDGLFSGTAASDSLVLEKERLYALGYVDPRTVESMGDYLLNRLVGSSGISFIVEDKLTGRRLAIIHAAKLTAVTMVITSKAVVARNVGYALGEMPKLYTEFFSK
jgi:hypothetical protein